jgi:tetratricopeptide (TPR) repeat protein
MKKFNLKFLAVAAAFVATSSFAQTIDDAKKFLYYERYKSAKETCEKLLAASGNDENAAYHLGQALIGLDNVPAAKALYQQKLSAAPNSPLLLAGMGHIGLIEGNNADAKSRFETAANLAGGKRIDVLNAIGAPNSDPEMKNGDPNFAIEKLNQAIAIKGFKHPEVYANLGDAYRKIGEGGSAIKSYDAALALNPNFARAIYRKGRLYQSQGQSQEPLYMQYYNDAIAKDANYAPVYNTLFSYYYESNVAKAAENLDKLLSVSDNDETACYKRASMKFAQGLFADAISKSNECIAAGGAGAVPNLYGLKAYAYAKTGDSVQAKQSFEEFFKRQQPARIGIGDLTSYAKLLLKFPGSEAQAAQYIEQAVAKDTTEAGKVNHLKIMANYYKEKAMFLDAANWFNRIVYVKKAYNNVDLYNAGYNYYRVGAFDSAIANFNKYAAKYPDEVFGHYMLAKSQSGIDSTMALGTAIPSYLKAIEVGEKAVDKTKVKDQLSGAYTYMMGYSFNIKKDQAAAIAYADKALALDPTDPQAIKNKEFVTANNPAAIKPPKPAATPRPAAGTKPGAAPAKPATPAKPAVPVKKK